MLKRRETTPEHAAPIPSFREFAERWAKLSDFIVCTDAGIDEKLDRIAELNAQFPESVHRRDVVRDAQPPSETELAARAHLAAALGEPAPEQHVAREPRLRIVPSNDAAAEAFALGAEIETLRAGLVIAHAELRKEHAKASRRYAELRAEEYASVAGRYRNAMIEMAAAWLAHQQYIQAAFIEQGASPAFLLPATTPDTSPVGDPRDRQSAIQEFLRHEAEAGRFSMSDAPVDWRPEAPREEPPAKPSPMRHYVRRIRVDRRGQTVREARLGDTEPQIIGRSAD